MRGEKKGEKKKKKKQRKRNISFKRMPEEGKREQSLSLEMAFSIFGATIASGTPSSSSVTRVVWIFPPLQLPPPAYGVLEDSFARGLPAAACPGAMHDIVSPPSLPPAGAGGGTTGGLS